MSKQPKKGVKTVILILVILLIDANAAPVCSAWQS